MLAHAHTQLEVRSSSSGELKAAPDFDRELLGRRRRRLARVGQRLDLVRARARGRGRESGWRICNEDLARQFSALASSANTNKGRAADPQRSVHYVAAERRPAISVNLNSLAIFRNQLTATEARTPAQQKRFSLLFLAT